MRDHSTRGAKNEAIPRVTTWERPGWKFEIRSTNYRNAFETRDSEPTPPPFGDLRGLQMVEAPAAEITRFGRWRRLARWIL